MAFSGQFQHHRMHVNVGSGAIALTWATPVEIIQLLEHLDNFESGLATSHALRLCNRFGRGPNAHITRLPRELIALIESDLFDQRLKTPVRQDSPSWASRYCCFEGSCRPSHHVQGQKRQEMIDQAITEFCYNYRQFDADQIRASQTIPDGFGTVFDQFCDSCCQSSYNSDTQSFFRQHGWKETVDKGGDLQHYTDLLRKYFGLETWLMHENMDHSTSSYLQRNNPRFSTDWLPVRVTICYLALPNTHVSHHTLIDYGCGDSGYAAGTSGKSMLVERESLELTEAHKIRFATCMKALKLDVFVHPSQLRGPLKASSARHENISLKLSSSYKKKDAAKIADEDSALTTHIRKLESGSWPRLMVLSKERYDADGIFARP